MKENTHPTNYREVFFNDLSCTPSNSSDELGVGQYIMMSTIQTKLTTTFKGKTYPLYNVEVSSSSHPFYTGTKKIVDTAGQVEKFQKKYKKFASNS